MQNPLCVANEVCLQVVDNTGLAVHRILCIERLSKNKCREPAFLVGFQRTIQNPLVAVVLRGLQISSKPCGWIFNEMIISESALNREWMCISQVNKRR